MEEIPQEVWDTIRKDDENSVRSFVSVYGANGIDSKGRTFLHHAAAFGCEKSTRILMENGANLHLKNRSGKSPLDIAVQGQSISCVEAMLSNCDFLSDKIIDLKPLELPYNDHKFESSYFDLLPPETIQNIFTFLYKDGLAFSLLHLRLICKSWYFLVNSHPIFYEKIITIHTHTSTSKTWTSVSSLFGYIMQTVITTDNITKTKKTLFFRTAVAPSEISQLFDTFENMSNKENVSEAGYVLLYNFNNDNSYSFSNCNGNIAVITYAYCVEKVEKFLKKIESKDEKNKWSVGGSFLYSENFLRIFSVTRKLYSEKEILFWVKQYVGRFTMQIEKQVSLILRKF